MTLGELRTRENLVGRVFRVHEKSGFAYRGIVDRAEERGDEVVFCLSRHARRFEGRDRGSWKNLPDAEIPYGKDLPAEKTVRGIFTVSLPNGSEVYLYPAGTRLENVENEPLL
jgi:hypothetical protein